MKHQVFARAAAAVLAGAALGGPALAQQKVPEPVTMTDTAPLPAHDRQSSGAVILMDQPVLAQREALASAQERSEVDTRTMGAGPAHILRRVFTEEALQQKRALEAAEREKVTPK